MWVKDMSLTSVTGSHMTPVKVVISLTLARRESAALTWGHSLCSRSLFPSPWPPLFVSPCFS